jgi:flagellar protein FlaI
LETLFSYNVGLSSVSIVRDPRGNYQYIVNDVEAYMYEAIAKHVSKALDAISPQRKVNIYDVTKSVLEYLKDYDPELVAYVVNRELKYKKLQVLLDDPYIEDISVVGPGPVWVRHKLVLERDPSADYIETNVIIGTHEELMSYMELIAERCGKVINKKVPIMDFTLPEDDGAHRVHIVLPDVAHTAGEIVIRKKAPYDFTDLDSLVKGGVMPGAVAELIKVAIRRGGSILILGPPGSGKTTLLKAILYSAIPRSWKIAIIEDTPEVDVPKGASWVRYTVPTDVWGAERGIDQMILAKAALRASVSRFIVIGETRGAEAKVLAQAMNMGLGGLCLPADQLLLAKVDGELRLHEIGELVEGIVGGTYRNVEVLSLGPDYSPTWVQISSAVIKTGNDRFVRIEVEEGATHEVHEDHLVLVAGEGNSFRLKKAKELVAGDLLVALPSLPKVKHCRKLITLGDDLLSLSDETEQNRGMLGVVVDPYATQTPDWRVLGVSDAELPSTRITIELSRYLGYIVGLFVGVGSIVRDSSGRATGVLFDVLNDEVATKLSESLKNVSQFGCSIKLTRDNEGGRIHVSVESSFLANLLLRLFRGDKRRELKEIPLGLVLEACDDFRAGVIEGLWDSLDHTRGSEGLKVRTKDRKVAESLALLLKTFGVSASVKMISSKAFDCGCEDLFEVSVESVGNREKLLRMLEFTHSEDKLGEDAVDTISSQGLQLLKVRKVEVVRKSSLLYDIEVPETHVYAISGSLILTHNTTFHAGSPEEAIVRLTSPPIDLTPQQLSMIWLFITLGFREYKGLKRVVVRVDEPVLTSNTLILNNIYRYGEEVDLETLLKRLSKARDL